MFGKLFDVDPKLFGKIQPVLMLAILATIVASEAGYLTLSHEVIDLLAVAAGALGLPRLTELLYRRKALRGAGQVERLEYELEKSEYLRKKSKADEGRVLELSAQLDGARSRAANAEKRLKVLVGSKLSRARATDVAAAVPKGGRWTKSEDGSYKLVFPEEEATDGE